MAQGKNDEKMESNRKIWTTLLVILIAKISAAQDPQFEREVLRSVEKTLNSIGDFSSLNENYMLHSVLLQNMNEEMGNLSVPGLAFELQGVETIAEVPREVVFLAIQVTYGIWDVEEGENKIGGMTIRRTTEYDGSEVLEVEILGESFTCICFAINIVSEAGREKDLFQIVFAKNFKDIEEESVVQSIEKKLTPRETLQLLIILSEVPNDKMRFKAEEENGDTYTSEQQAVMMEQAADWLEYTSYSYAFRFVYALLNMNREQLLSAENIDVETRAGIVPNVFYLNQQLYEVQQKIETMPYVYSVGRRDFNNATQEVVITQSTKENCLGRNPMTYESFYVWDENGKGSFLPGRDIGSMSYAISLNVASGVVLRGSVEVECAWKTYDNKFRLPSTHIGDFDMHGTYQCSATLSPTVDLLFNGATSTPYDVNSLSTVTLDTIVQERVIRTRYGSPTQVSIEQVGYMAYGLRYMQMSRNDTVLLNEENYSFLFSGNMRLSFANECYKNCWIIYDNELKMAGFEDWVPYFQKLVRPIIGENRVWNPDLETITVARAGEQNTAVKIFFAADDMSPVEKIANVQVDRSADVLPFSQMNSVNILAYQLNVLSNEVADLAERVQYLEDAVYHSSQTIWGFIARGLNMVDIAFSVVELGKYGKQLTKASTSALKRNSRTEDNPLAHQFKKKSIDSDKIAGSYSVLSGIDNAAQVSSLQGHSKNYFYNKPAQKTKTQDITMKDILANKQDTREVMELNPSVFSKVQSEVFATLKQSDKQWKDFTTTPFGVVTVHKSPIEIPMANGASKYISSKYSGTQSGRAFLSNEQQAFPFHTSVSSSAIEIRTDDKIVLNTRFTGVAEPSIIGPTNAKNPQVKVGYVKIQHEVISDGSTSTLKLLPWHDTQIKPGVNYSQKDVDELFRSFFPKSKHELTTDEKWELVARQTSSRMNTRDKIDYVPVQSNIFLGTLDDLMFFSKSGSQFKYNLLNNNCQTYARAFAQMAAYGSTNMDLLVSDFRSFAMRVADFANDYFSQSPSMQQVASWAGRIKSFSVSSSLRTLLRRSAEALRAAAY